jgi:hypothetical protein
MSRLVSHRRLFAVAALCSLCFALLGASRGSITKLTLDPEAPVVDLFDGMEQSQFDVRLVAQNANEGRIFITNKTDKVLTVAVPKGLVGVQVLPQIVNPQFGNQFGFGQNNLGAGISGQGQNGLAQTVGGNAAGLNGGSFPGGQQGFGQNNGFNAQGFFSIPPEKTVQIGLNSVCLNYGRREPHAGMKYQLVKAESAYTDPALVQLLEDYSPRMNRDAQQAAAWHLANGLSWDQIARLTDRKVPGNPTPLFTAQQLQGARGLVEQAKKAAADLPKKTGIVRSAVAAK